MALSKRVRFEVFKRDLFTCQYCGRRPPDVVLECDHVRPRCDGGSDEMDNLTTSCADCNRGKSGVGLADVRPALDEMTRLAAMQEMGERAALLAKQQASAKAEDEMLDAVVYDFWEWWMNDLDPNVAQLGEETDRSLKIFLRNGLTRSEIRQALDRAVGKYQSKRQRMSWDEVWRYFCGSCWGMIRKREGRE